MRIIIAGSRNYTDTKDFFIRMDRIIDSEEWILSISEVVSGTARGVDTMGEVWADHFDVPVKRFPADWAKHGRGAGHIRNAEMAKYAEGLIAFWDGISPGTASMINLAKAEGLKTFIEMI